MICLDQLKELVRVYGNWKEYNLTMSKEGFESLSRELPSNDKMPQVYVHVCTQEGKFYNRILRIGKAETGCHNRWIKSKVGHKETFLWSIGDSEIYQEKNAKDYWSYQLLFAGLNGLNTKLCILSFEENQAGKIVARAIEQLLIGIGKPLWESFNKICNKEKTNIKETLAVGKGDALKWLTDKRSQPDQCCLCDPLSIGPDLIGTLMDIGISNNP